MKTKPERIRITYCKAFGSSFENITSGSIHKVISTPIGEKEDGRGVWVLGAGEPVKVLNNEFEIVSVSL